MSGRVRAKCGIQPSLGRAPTKRRSTSFANKPDQPSNALLEAAPKRQNDWSLWLLQGSTTAQAWTVTGPLPASRLSDDEKCGFSREAEGENEIARKYHVAAIDCGSDRVSAGLAGYASDYRCSECLHHEPGRISQLFQQSNGDRHDHEQGRHDGRRRPRARRRRGTPDGSKVYVANEAVNGTVSVIDTATNAVSATVAVGSNPVGVAVAPDGGKVYVANKGRHSTVSVIDTATDSVSTTIDIDGLTPMGVAVTPDGSKVYVANDVPNGTVSVIDTATNTVSATVAVGRHPVGVAVKPDGSKLYVANKGNGNISVIDATNKVVATIDVGLAPFAVAVAPDGSKVYVTNLNNTVSVIDTATNAVSATISVGNGPLGVAFTPDGSKAYVANQFDHTVSVIATASNTVVATIDVGTSPIAFGIFILPRFAGTRH